MINEEMPFNKSIALQKLSGQQLRRGGVFAGGGSNNRSVGDTEFTVDPLDVYGAIVSIIISYVYI